MPDNNAEKNDRNFFLKLMNKRNLTAFGLSAACLYIPFVWTFHTCSYMRPIEIIKAYFWFPGVVPAMLWFGRDDLTRNSSIIAAVLLIILYGVVRQGGTVAKIALIGTVLITLVMSALLRRFLLA